MFLRAAGLLETGPRSTSAFQKYSGKGSVVVVVVFFFAFLLWQVWVYGI